MRTVLADKLAHWNNKWIVKVIVHNLKQLARSKVKYKKYLSEVTDWRTSDVVR